MTTDEALEASITNAGREQVFALVRAAGWSPGQPVPKHVWEEAVVMTLRAKLSVCARTLRETEHG